MLALRMNIPCCCCSVAQLCQTLQMHRLATCQASPVLTISQSLFKFISIESVMPYHPRCPVFLSFSIFPRIKFFFNRWSSSHQVTKDLQLQLHAQAHTIPKYSMLSKFVKNWPRGQNYIIPAFTFHWSALQLRC